MICKVHGSLTPFLSGCDIAQRNTFSNTLISHPLMLVGHRVAESGSLVGFFDMTNLSDSTANT